MLPVDPAGGSNPIHAWLHQIHQDHIWFMQSGHLNCFLAVSRLSHRLKILVDHDEFSQSTAYSRVFIYEQYADASHRTPQVRDGIRALQSNFQEGKGARSGSSIIYQNQGRLASSNRINPGINPGINPWK